MALYGCVLIISAVAYTLLAIADPARRYGLGAGRATGGDFKGKISLAIYATAIGLACLKPALPVALYVVVSMIWFIPGKRIERTLGVR